MMGPTTSLTTLYLLSYLLVVLSRLDIGSIFPFYTFVMPNSFWIVLETNKQTKNIGK